MVMNCTFGFFHSLLSAEMERESAFGNQPDRKSARALRLPRKTSSIFPEEKTWTELMRMLRSADKRADAGEYDSIWKIRRDWAAT
jgi:hypothetical protein